MSIADNLPMDTATATTNFGGLGALKRFGIASAFVGRKVELELRFGILLQAGEVLAVADNPLGSGADVLVVRRVQRVSIFSLAAIKRIRTLA